jgi:hypothetical protein
MTMSRSFVLPAVVACVLASPAIADELWRQNPLNSFGGLSSQDARNPGGLGWFSEVVDNFDAAAGWTITDLEFWGGYAAVIPGNTHGFMIRFYENNGGQVGPLLFTQDVMTFTETVYYTLPVLNFPGYHTTLGLSPAFAVPAAGSYWVSVVAILDRGGTANEPQWGWVQAVSTTQPSCMQWFFSPGNFTPQGFDVSFVLNGTTGGCYPDCNQDGVLTVQDFGCFQTQFVQGTPYADCNGDGALTVADFGCFQTKFVQGCP